MTNREERVTAQWVYMGQRTTTGGSLAHCWLTDNGNEALFSKLKASSVGGVYEVLTSPDRKFVYGTTAKYIGPSDDERSDQWSLESATARTLHDARKAEKTAAKDKPLRNMTLGEINELLVRSLPDRRRALLAVVLKEIGA